jgi:hypothetical protein
LTTIEINLIYLEEAAQQMNLEGANLSGMWELGWIFKRPSMVGAFGVEAEKLHAGTTKKSWKH